jgi:hypothetical protein
MSNFTLIITKASIKKQLKSLKSNADIAKAFTSIKFERNSPEIRLLKAKRQLSADLGRSARYSVNEVDHSNIVNFIQQANSLVRRTSQVSHRKDSQKKRFAAQVS